MSAQTVSNAVAERDAGPAALVRESRSWFNTILPSHVDANAFVALAVAYLRKNQALARVAQNNAQGFLAALSECARLGLVPGDTYHLVPFGNEITGIVDYKGEIELIYRAGAVSSVKAEIVCKNDHFRYTTDMDRPDHAPDWFGNRGDIIGAYAYAVMKDGATSKVIVYSKREIDAVKAVAKGASRSDSPWVLWYDRMALKTVIHRLANFVPTSAEYHREQLRAAAEVSQQVNSTVRTTAQTVNTATGEVVDAEIVDETQNVPPADGQAPPAPAEPAVTPAGTAGGTPRLASTGQVGMIRKRFAELYPLPDGESDQDRWERLLQTSKLAGIDTTVTSVGSTKELTSEQASRVLDALKKVSSAAQLEALTGSGEVSGE